LCVAPYGTERSEVTPKGLKLYILGLRPSLEGIRLLGQFIVE
jgi:hypothetical protein